MKNLTARHAARCGGCHKASEVTRLEWIHLRQPQRSLFLTAPLAREAGGSGKCQKAIYADATDPDYQAVLNLVQSAVQKATAFPRRDVRSLDP